MTRIYVAAGVVLAVAVAGGILHFTEADPVATFVVSGAALGGVAWVIGIEWNDAVIAGGSDSLCGLTAHGFASLKAVARRPTNPFSVNRDGLTLGEGAALFLVTRESSGIQLLGAGESSEAHHISSPDPEGAGALASMRGALRDAGAQPAQVAYLNLHGTGTKLNDAMESRAVAELFGVARPKSWQGRSLMPALAGKPLPPKPAFAELLPCRGWDHSARSMISGDGARHVFFVFPRRWELFDLDADPDEKKDLSRSDPRFEELKGQLLQWMERS